jgi:hypothetical protein
MMQDKFFNSVRDRFEFHRRTIAREFEGLEGLHADHINQLSPDFWSQIEAMKAALKRLDELIEELPKD